MLAHLYLKCNICLLKTLIAEYLLNKARTYFSQHSDRLRTFRVRGDLRFHRMLRLCGNSNHSAQRLAEPRRSALAFCHFSILIFFAGGFELEWGGKKAGRASCKETGSGRNEMQMPWCLVHSVIFECPWLKSPSSASASDISAMATRA